MALANLADDAVRKSTATLQTLTGNLTSPTLTASTSFVMGAASNAGLTVQAYTGGSKAAIYSNAVTPGASNYSLLTDSVSTTLNASASVLLAIGGTTAATITNTGLNSTPIGATTPSTGAFTTLSASGDATISGKIRATAAAAANAIFSAFQTGVFEWTFGQRGSNGHFVINNAGNFAGTDIVDVSSTGLSVTGTVSSTTGITNTASGGNSTLTLSGSGAYSSIVTLNGGGGGGGYITSAGGQLRLNAPTGQTITGEVNNSVITTTSSTGLAVTGALSATGGITNTSTNGSNSLITLTQTGVGNVVLRNNATNGNFVIQNLGVDQATLDTSGNLGLGVTPSAATIKQFEFGSAGNVLGSGGTNDLRLGANWTYNSGYKYATTAVASLYQQAAGVHYWYTAPSGTAGNAITFTQAMTLDSSGNLLVGTTTAPNATFICKSTIRGVQIENPADVTKWRQIVFANNSTDATLYFYNGTNQATLTSAGAWTNASDARLKKNIVDIKHGLADVMRTQPRSYNMIDVDGDYVGFIAQELQTVIPEVVSGDPDKQLGVDYGSLVAVAFKAIQEQQAQIQSLTARLSAAGL